jgi:hypothetical protein
MEIAVLPLSLIRLFLRAVQSWRHDVISGCLKTSLHKKLVCCTYSQISCAIVINVVPYITKPFLEILLEDLLYYFSHCWESLNLYPSLRYGPEFHFMDHIGP